MRLICFCCNVTFESVRQRKYCSKKCIRKQYELRYPERVVASKNKWIENNPDKRKNSSRAYQQKNWSYYVAYASKYSRQRKWAKMKLDEFSQLWVEELYDAAKRRGLEVDHIVPLKHEKVCGLHVPWNMQLLTRSQNAKKSNSFSDEDILVVLKKANQ